MNRSPHDIQWQKHIMNENVSFADKFFVKVALKMEIKIIWKCESSTFVNKLLQS